MTFRSKFGIATVLTAVFGGLVALSTGILLAISLSFAFDTTRASLTARVELLLDEALQIAASFYQPMESKARWLADEILAGRIVPAGDEAFRSVLFGAVADTEQISAISYQWPDGSGFFYERDGDVLHTVEWPPAWRAVLNARTNGPQTSPAAEGQWVLRPSVLDGTPLGTFIMPVRDAEGQDMGVIGVRRNQVPLARTFAEDNSMRHFELVRFMLFNDRIVIGHPELATKSKTVRLTVEELDDPFLKEMGDAERQPIVLLDEIEDAESFRIDTAAGSRMFILRPVRDYVAGGNLLIGVHFDPSAGAPEIRRILGQAAFGVVLFVAAVLLAIWFGRRAALPMRRLATAAEQVQAEQLEDFEPLPIGPVKELATASGAFNSMVDGLRERKRIRDLFGKYVPEDVAALLLTDDAASAPRNATATVLFLDIVGFSTISERLEPAEVVDTMNAFFSDAVQAIEQNSGMVAQFQGDALLAVFNVPIVREDHAEAAVRAAQAILRTVQAQTYGGQRLECRIGINTGPVVAGAIGARDRLSYTVYGDTVNVASRLESLNKELDTLLLISESTAERIQNLTCEAKGEITVRGRKAPVTVFSVLA